MRYQYSLRTMVILTTLVAGAFGCAQISNIALAVYLTVVIMTLDMWFRHKYGPHYLSDFFGLPHEFWTPRRVQDVVWFAAVGALFGVGCSPSMVYAWLTGLLAVFCAAIGASLGIILWVLLFVDRKPRKEE